MIIKKDKGVCKQWAGLQGFAQQKVGGSTNAGMEWTTGLVEGSKFCNYTLAWAATQKRGVADDVWHQWRDPVLELVRVLTVHTLYTRQLQK